MDLKEYFLIIKKQAALFAAIVIFIIAGAFGFFYLRPISYGTSLMLNVTRTGTQDTPDYKYDNFYRLQADEKFTETLVQWLKSPRVELDIFNEAGIDTKSMGLKDLTRAIRPEKMSSQVVLVSYSTPSLETARKISQSIVKITANHTDQLNKDQQDETWFKVLAGDPVIVRNEADAATVFGASLAMGLFLAFWAVMIRHYLR